MRSERGPNSNAQDDPTIQESEGNISRRKFLKKAAKATVGFSALLLQKGMSQFETELHYRHEGEKNWERWLERLNKHLDESMQYLRTLDVAETAQREFEDSKNKGYVLPLEYYTDRVKKYLPDCEANYVELQNLTHRLSDIPLYRQLLPALVNGLEEYKREKPQNEKYRVYHGAIISGVKNILEKIDITEVIKREYGIEIIATSRDFFQADMKSVYRDFQRIPPFTVRSAKVGKIYIEEMLMVAGEAIPLPLFGVTVDTKHTGEGAPVHELIHYLDFLNNNVWKFWEDGADEHGWREINKGAVPYKYPFGAIAAIAQKIFGVDAKDKETKLGYARNYGWQGGIFEDKATVAEAVLKTKTLRELLSRSVNDPVLKRKIEYMTGYHLDNPFQFERGEALSDEEVKSLEPYADVASKDEAILVSLGIDKSFWPGEEEKIKKLIDRVLIDESFRHAIEFYEHFKIKCVAKFGSPVLDQEFQEAGFRGKEYWSKWSRDGEGKVWMDAEYYNALVDGSEVRFEEKDGETIRVIEPPKEEK